MAWILAKYAELYAVRYGETDPEEMFVAWMEPERKQAALRLLEDAELFRQVVDAASPVLQAFEATALSALYRKAAAAIRETDAHGLLFLETNYFSNLGTRSMIEPVIGLDGIRDEQQVYAPHAYDLVTDTGLAHTANDARLELILTRHEETRQRLEMPLLVGEWGAFYGSPDTGHVPLHIQRQLEKLLCSDTYWDYTPDMDRSPSFLGVRRGYPVAVAGTLKQYRYEHELGSFSMRWEEAGESKAARSYICRLFAMSRPGP
ncbi:glycoside hydrolase family 5 protein [Paenibacillus thiaminolyticus]|nr:glycoside hydrolase family 5 protein [Paenibacillus thiaminolyticus]